MSLGESPAAPVARVDVSLQSVGREAILHDARSGMAHVINASAAQVWRLCDGRPLDQLLVAFGAAYGRSPADVRPDVERVIAGFSTLGLLEDGSVVPG